ncbi:hypothetical protein D3C73_873830 [compost metagenome]
MQTGQTKLCDHHDNQTGEGKEFGADFVGQCPAQRSDNDHGDRKQHEQKTCIKWRQVQHVLRIKRGDDVKAEIRYEYQKTA